MQVYLVCQSPRVPYNGAFLFKIRILRFHSKFEFYNHLYFSLILRLDRSHVDNFSSYPKNTKDLVRNIAHHWQSKDPFSMKQKRPYVYLSPTNTNLFSM